MGRYSIATKLIKEHAGIFPRGYYDFILDDKEVACERVLHWHISPLASHKKGGPILAKIIKDALKSQGKGAFVAYDESWRKFCMALKRGEYLVAPQQELTVKKKGDCGIVDLYITDGKHTKVVAVEIKLHHILTENQLKKYVQAIDAERKSTRKASRDYVVLFLTLHGNAPEIDDMHARRHVIPVKWKDVCDVISTEMGGSLDREFQTYISRRTTGLLEPTQWKWLAGNLEKIADNWNELNKDSNFRFLRDTLNDLWEVWYGAVDEAMKNALEPLGLTNDKRQARGKQFRYRNNPLYYRYPEWPKRPHKKKDDFYWVDFYYIFHNESDCKENNIANALLPFFAQKGSSSRLAIMLATNRKKAGVHFIRHYIDDLPLPPGWIPAECECKHNGIVYLYEYPLYQPLYDGRHVKRKALSTKNGTLTPLVRQINAMAEGQCFFDENLQAFGEKEYSAF